jgi:RNA polymerase sigma-70 factor (family 1)
MDNNFLFTKIYTDNYAKLYRYALVLTKDPQRAQDITQQTFMKLWENMNRVNFERDGDIFTLLFVIAKRIEIDETRKHYILKRKYELDIQQIRPEADTSRTPDVILSNKDWLNNLNSFIENLPEQKRRVYSLNKLHGFTHKEIADMLNISVDTVRSHLKQAAGMLKRYIHTRNLFSLLWWLLYLNARL